MLLTLNVNVILVSLVWLTLLGAKGEGKGGIGFFQSSVDLSIRNWAVKWLHYFIVYSIKRIPIPGHDTVQGVGENLGTEGKEKNENGKERSRRRGEDGSDSERRAV